MRAGRAHQPDQHVINRRRTDAVSQRQELYLSGSFVLMFEELMKANRAWRLQDTAGAAMRPARLVWSEPPPS